MDITTNTHITGKPATVTQPLGLNDLGCFTIPPGEGVTPHLNVALSFVDARTLIDEARECLPLIRIGQSTSKRPKHDVQGDREQQMPPNSRCTAWILS